MTAESPMDRRSWTKRAAVAAVLGMALLAPGASAAQTTERPNIIYILLDDVGFSDLGPYGSEIATPSIDALAAGGLRYNRFDTRAICSPTRAALLTGRNNQAVGMMDLAANPSPSAPAHSQGFITPAAATVAQMLRMNGYGTSAVGKWHLTPPAQQADSSTNHANWPSGKGFQNFYGFLTGWTDQYEPLEQGIGGRMNEGDRPILTPAPLGYHVSEAIVDRAIDYLKRDDAAGRPSFLYLAFGAGHAPIQAPRSYIDKYRGRYDRGWDRIREERFARQKQLGIIPANAVLTPRSADDPAWESLSADQKKVFARFMEVYAGFIEHTDAQIGRLVAHLKETGEYENTLIFFMSDNGAASETLGGGFDRPYGSGMTVQQMLARLDDLGGPESSALYQRPWGWAGATPFQRYKLWPHGGGVRDPLIVTWPRVIRDGGAVRRQYVEAIDISPTVLDVLGLAAPPVVDGVVQMPIHGASIRQTFTNADAPTRTTQFYLMRGNRAITHEGWKAVAIHAPGTPFEQDRWELYDVANDYSESTDVAARHPEKLKELVGLWWSEATKYGGLPLLERGAAGGGGAGARPPASGGTR
jgi:arylsulfatase A-like enzyme